MQYSGIFSQFPSYNFFLTQFLFLYILFTRLHLINSLLFFFTYNFSFTVYIVGKTCEGNNTEVSPVRLKNNENIFLKKLSFYISCLFRLLNNRSHSTLIWVISRSSFIASSTSFSDGYA
jgi:hypothetical protein